MPFPHRLPLLLALLLGGAPARTAAHVSGASLLTHCGFTAQVLPATESILASLPVDLAVRLYRTVVVPDGGGGSYSGEREAVRWRELKTRHLRRVHVVFVCDDLDVFMHVHPEDSGGGGGGVSDSGAEFEGEGGAATHTPSPLASEVDAVEFNLRNLTFPRVGKYAMLMTFAVGVEGALLDCDATGLARDTPGAEEEVRVVRYLDVTAADEDDAPSGGGGGKRDGVGGGDGGDDGGDSNVKRASPLLSAAVTIMTRAVAFQQGPGAVQRQPDAVSLSVGHQSCCSDDGGGGGARGEGDGGGVCYAVAFGLVGEPSPPPSSEYSTLRGTGSRPILGSTVVSFANGGEGEGTIVTGRYPQQAPPPSKAKDQVQGEGQAEGGGVPACVGLQFTVSTAHVGATSQRGPHVDHALMPYLGAGAHLTLVSADLAFVSHGLSDFQVRQLASAQCGAARALPPGSRGMRDLPAAQELVGTSFVAALELPADAGRGQFFKVFASFADRSGLATAGFVFYVSRPEAGAGEGAGAEANLDGKGNGDKGRNGDVEGTAAWVAAKASGLSPGEGGTAGESGGWCGGRRGDGGGGGHADDSKNADDAEGTESAGTTAAGGSQWLAGVAGAGGFHWTSDALSVPHSQSAAAAAAAAEAAVPSRFHYDMDVGGGGSGGGGSSGWTTFGVVAATLTGTVALTVVRRASGARSEREATSRRLDRLEVLLTSVARRGGGGASGGAGGEHKEEEADDTGARW